MKLAKEPSGQLSAVLTHSLPTLQRCRLCPVPAAAHWALRAPAWASAVGASQRRTQGDPPLCRGGRSPAGTAAGSSCLSSVTGGLRITASAGTFGDFENSGLHPCVTRAASVPGSHVSCKECSSPPSLAPGQGLQGPIRLLRITLQRGSMPFRHHRGAWRALPGKMTILQHAGPRLPAQQEAAAEWPGLLQKGPGAPTSPSPQPPWGH